MSGTTAPQPFSDSFWSNPHTFNSLNGGGHPVFSKEKKKRTTLAQELNAFVDEAPEFFDPYSDLNLFLAQKIRLALRKDDGGKKWSQRLQEHLLKEISEEFQKTFTQYRLTVAALKKTWEKIVHFTHQIEQSPRAIKEDGGVNIDFLIKENLSQYRLLKNPYQLHPYHYAHQLSVKISECVASLDGKRISLDKLAKNIWAQQRHLLPAKTVSYLKTPYDEYDTTDKLIVKIVLGVTAKEPCIEHAQLESRVQEIVNSLRDLPNFASLEMMTLNVSALLAQKLYAASSFHSAFLPEQKQAMINFIRRQSLLCKSSGPSINTAVPMQDCIRRIQALYMLASRMPKDLTPAEFKNAVAACYPMVKLDRPDVDQSIYAFIAAESVLMKNDQYCHSVDYVCDAIYQAYSETRLLPSLLAENTGLVEMLIWKVLSEQEGFLLKLPYVIGQMIDEEIAYAMIDNPNHSFSGIVQSTVDFLKKTKELSLQKKWSDVEKKIRRWTLQGDMICRFIRIDADAPLYRCLQQSLKIQQSHAQIVAVAAQQYLAAYPQLAPYSQQLTYRLWTLQKYFWYAIDQDPEQTSLERFIQWHTIYDTGFSPYPLEERLKRMLPLAPIC